MSHMFTSAVQDWQLPPHRKKHCIDCLGIPMSIPKTTEMMGMVVLISTCEHILEVNFHQVIYFNAQKRQSGHKAK